MPETPKLRPEQRDLQALFRKHKARAAVLITETGEYAYWQDGISGDDPAHDLISIANNLRRRANRQEPTR